MTTAIPKRRIMSSTLQSFPQSDERNPCKPSPCHQGRWYVRRSLRQSQKDQKRSWRAYVSAQGEQYSQKQKNSSSRSMEVLNSSSECSHSIKHDRLLLVEVISIATKVSAH